MSLQHQDNPTLPETQQRTWSTRGVLEIASIPALGPCRRRGRRQQSPKTGKAEMAAISHLSLVNLQGGPSVTHGLPVYLERT